MLICIFYEPSAHLDANARMEVAKQYVELWSRMKSGIRNRP